MLIKVSLNIVYSDIAALRNELYRTFILIKTQR